MNDYRGSLVLKAFAKLDRNGSGSVDIEDIRGVYNASKHPAVVDGRKTSDQVLGEFLETFESHHNIMNGGSNDNVVALDEFIDYYCNVSSSIDDDIYFAQMINSSWHLTEDASPYHVYDGNWKTDVQQNIPASRPFTAVGSYQRRDNVVPTGQPTLRSGLPSSDFPFNQ